jgi:hypothetical protein
MFSGIPAGCGQPLSFLTIQDHGSMEEIKFRVNIAVEDQRLATCYICAI